MDLRSCRRRSCHNGYPDDTGFWPITDNQASPSLWDTVRQAILAEFNGVDKPSVGFWMENLATSRPAEGQDPITGKPATNFGAPLYNSQGETWANFQDLTPWSAPFPHHVSAVSNSTAADGISYAFSTYGSTYVELYVQDIDKVSYQNELREWSRRLTSTELQLGLIDMTSTNRVLQWNRTAPVTEIDATPSLMQPFDRLLSVTNRFQHNLPTDSASNTFRFFRVQQTQ
ncbi:MAG: hypothetical protein FJ220_05075 [Kiritimatiellaceae bacterium]|nr:hypothetical protein [Kiritimatiellaceae bacterium]